MGNSQTIRPMQIILAVDGSEHAWAAIQLVKDLPLHPDSSITCLAALDSPRTPRMAALLGALEEAQVAFQAAPWKVTSGVVHGSPAKALLEFEEEHPADLLVVGAKGLRATLGILLGGVAQQVVEHANCPVLVVRAPYRRLQRLLVTADGSRYSRQAIAYLQSFPIPEQADLQVMHVLPPVPIPRGEKTPTMYPITNEMLPPILPTPEEEALWRAAEEREGEDLLKDAVRRLAPYGGDLTSRLTRGDAATEIIEYADDHNVDLIVAGSRGLGAVRGWLLGSVSRKLVHYARCSVLIVKSELDLE